MKAPVTIVPHQKIGGAILGGVIRRWVFVLIGSLIIKIQTEIYVQPPITIVVGDGRTRERLLWRLGKVKCIGLVSEFAAPLIEKQHRPPSAYHNQILLAIIIEICKKRTSRIVQDADSRFLRHILEGSISSVTIQAIGKSSGLTNVQIVKAIVINVPNRNTVVAVDVNAACAVENRPPVVRSVQQLRRVG